MSAISERLENAVEGKVPWCIELYYDNFVLVDEAIKCVDSEIGDSRGYSDAYLNGEQPKASLYATLHGGKELARQWCCCRVLSVQEYAKKHGPQNCKANLLCKDRISW
jgi:hypothetical protein